MNSSGKVLVIFLVITAILLISLTAMSLFFFQKETERRKLAEATLEEYRSEKETLEEGLNKIKKQNFLLQEKNKEADERVNDLSDELELEKGLREEMKLEMASFKEKMEETLKERDGFAEEIKTKEALQEESMENLSALERKIKDLEEQLTAAKKRSEKLGQLYEQQRQAQASLREEVQAQKETASQKAAGEETPGNQGVDLEEIVVVSGDVKLGKVMSAIAAGISLEDTVAILDTALNGRILSVDAETEFVIVSLGASDGLAVGNILSVYRDDNYMGDIKITRLQSEMAAADLILPFSISTIMKNDQVKAK